MADKPGSTSDELEAPLSDWPLYSDPVSELVEAIVRCRTAVTSASDLDENLPTDLARLYDVILRFHNRLLEVELELLQFRSKGRAPSKAMLIADKINRTLRGLGFDEEGIRTFWAEFHSEDGPTEADAKRQAASRAARS